MIRRFRVLLFNVIKVLAHELEAVILEHGDHSCQLFFFLIREILIAFQIVKCSILIQEQLKNSEHRRHFIYKISREVSGQEGELNDLAFVVVLLFSEVTQERVGAECQ